MTDRKGEKDMELYKAAWYTVNIVADDKLPFDK